MRFSLFELDAIPFTEHFGSRSTSQKVHIFPYTVEEEDHGLRWPGAISS